MIDIYLFSLGIILSYIADTIWRIKFWGKDRGKLSWLEHYHWGLAAIALSLLLSNILFLGFGLGLVLKESEQNHPFAYGSRHFKQSCGIGVAIIIGVVVELII